MKDTLANIMNNPVSDRFSPLLDEKQLKVFEDIGIDQIRDLVEEMLADTPSMIQRVVDALVAGDPERGRSVVHEMRGMFLNFGCTTIAGRIGELEIEWPDVGTDPAPIIDGIHECWDRTAEELTRWMDAAHP
ncbi:hypothetical protein [Luteolibacter sp. LG18]|uniref:hypothetical protein n=1 Tax=Luteolibacter sp. LG18 TaxID=2819286 RepID=UPI002B2A0831|nr:hypothetical protein llg_42840 [Luteolibacter sp. LG18]